MSVTMEVNTGRRTLSGIRDRDARAVVDQVLPERHDAARGGEALDLDSLAFADPDDHLVPGHRPTVLRDHEDSGPIVARGERGVRHECGLLDAIENQAGADEQTRLEPLARVRHGQLDPRLAGGLAEDRCDPHDRAAERLVGVGVRGQRGGLTRAQTREVALRDRERGVERVELDDGEDRGVRGQVVSRLRVPLGHDPLIVPARPVRRDLRVAQPDPGRLEGGLRAFHLGLGDAAPRPLRLLVGPGDVELLVGRDPALPEGLDALEGAHGDREGALGLDDAGVRHREIGLRLRDGLDELVVVEPRDDTPARHRIAQIELEALDPAADLGRDRERGGSLEGPDERAP
jgi:hypothetical protein